MEHTKAVEFLGALAHEHRLAVVRLLLEHAPIGLPAGVIGERLGLAPATLSFHLKELAHADLITARQAGRFIYYTVNYKAMNALVAYLTENCCRGVTCDIECDIECAPASTLKRKAS